MRAWRIVDGLRLDGTAAPRVLSVFAVYDERQLVLLDEKRDIVRELRTEATATNPNDARILQTIEKLAANCARLRTLRDERFAALRRVLSPVQQAKLLLLLPRLDRDLVRPPDDVDARQHGHDED